MKKNRKILIGAVILLLLVMVGGGSEDGVSNYWNDKMIPAIQVRCLSEVEDAESTLLSKQKFCACVTDKFKRTWKSNEAFQTDLRPAVSSYFAAEDSMKSRDRNEAILIVESEIGAFYKDLLLKMGMKWSGSRFEKKQKAIEKIIEPIFESSKRHCAKPKPPKS
jgi:hypothetical protein